MSTVYEMKKPIKFEQLFFDYLVTDRRLTDIEKFPKEKKWRMTFTNTDESTNYLWFSVDKDENIWNFIRYGCSDVSEMITKLSYFFQIPIFDEHTVESIPTLKGYEN